MSQPWLSAEEIAVHLGVTKDTVYAWIAKRGMPAHKVSHLWKLRTHDVDEWVSRAGASNATSGTAP